MVLIKHHWKTNFQHWYFQLVIRKTSQLIPSFSYRHKHATPTLSKIKADGTRASLKKLAVLSDAQSANRICQSPSRLLGQANKNISLKETMLRRSFIDGALQKRMLQPLRQRPLHLSHHRFITGHSQQCCKYSTIRREFYWPNIAIDVCWSVGSCRSCADGGSTFKPKCHLPLLPLAVPLEFLEMDTLVLLTEARKGNQHVMTFTDRNLELTRAMPIRKISMTDVACIIIDACVVLHAILLNFLTENNGKFFCKLFCIFCT